MRNRLTAAEALNEYLKVRLQRLQQKDCSSGGVCSSSSSSGSSVDGYSSISNEPFIDKCRVSSSLQGGESSTGSHEMWSVSCSDKSASDSNDSFRLGGGEGPDGVVAIMSSYGKSVLLSRTSFCSCNAAAQFKKSITMGQSAIIAGPALILLCRSPVLARTEQSSV